MVAAVTFGTWMITSPKEACRAQFTIEFPEDYNFEIQICLMRYLGAAALTLGGVIGTCDFTKNTYLLMGVMPIVFSLMHLHYTFNDPILYGPHTLIKLLLGGAMSATCLGSYKAIGALEEKEQPSKEMKDDKGGQGNKTPDQEHTSEKDDGGGGGTTVDAGHIKTH